MNVLPDYYDASVVEEAIQSAMPELILLKEAVAAASHHHIFNAVAKVRWDNEAIVPSTPEAMAKYRADQGVPTGQIIDVNPRAAKTRSDCIMVSAAHCRAIEIQGLRDHQLVLQLEAENSILRDDIAQKQMRINKLEAALTVEYAKRDWRSFVPFLTLVLSLAAICVGVFWYIARRH